MKLSGCSVLFRVDASRHIGSGHVMRALTLADELRSRGAVCRFAGKQAAGDLLDVVRGRGYDTIALSPAPFDWESDAEELRESLGTRRVDLLICDHYGVDDRWESALRERCGKLMVVDDLANRRHGCDLLLDQNLGRAPSDYSRLVPVGCTVLAGPAYALLRPQFSAAREQSLARRRAARPQSVNRMLVSLGGADEPNATGQVLNAIDAVEGLRDCKVDVVLGAASRWSQDINSQIGKLRLQIEVHSDVTNMAALMSVSDLAIGASGGTSWERCCLGLPALMVILADNQWPGARALAAASAARVIGDTQDIPAMLPGMISAILRGDSLSQMSQAAARVCDGEGVARVLEHLERR